ncbi:PREDICTED: dual specificity protein phosphatase 12 isoform X1 [Gekko japonicus]|uniref:protein-tyrosine-phosphatase n=1 Tax=Gekko japonicus TaxID=146911 RepID=A0ABM1K3V1_GEKJA|nr:PREDICTED: dual specificity protein phosphatase 12 isoform X1 [Gekko japonicus]
MVPVLPGLYLGCGLADAEEAGRGVVTALLLVDSEPPAAAEGELEAVLRVPLLDEPLSDLLSHLDACAAFISRARKGGGAVLVRCHAGVSRSVAVVTAYLMKANNLPFEEAYAFVRSLRPEAKMNEGFEWQLKLYERMGCEVDVTSPLYKQYRLQKVTEKYPELRDLPRDIFAADPSVARQTPSYEALYKCRKCRCGEPLGNESLATSMMYREAWAGVEWATQRQQPTVIPVASDEAPAAEEGVAGRRERRRITICGHSAIFWAALQAKKKPIGSQLGLSELASVEWLGRPGLKWPGLIPLLFKERRGPPPHVLLIHLGGNDLGLVKGIALALQAKADLELIRSRWPGVQIVWSAMLPRHVWQGVGDPRCLDRARRKVNRELRNALVGGLGQYLPHPEIRIDVVDLYREDGVLLSDKGNDIFLADLQQGLRAALGCPVDASS